MSVRALFRAATVKDAPSPYDTIHLKVFYPAQMSGNEQEQNIGIVPADAQQSPFKVVRHSAGGRVAIESADPRFFPQVVAAFAYGAYTAAILQLGYGPGTNLPLPDSLPLLLIGGTCDGVIAKSSDRYGVTWEQPTTPVTRTFEEAIAGGRKDSYLLLLEGANHFSIADPFDSTTDRPFLDFPVTQPEAKLRDLMSEAIGL